MVYIQQHPAFLACCGGGSDNVMPALDAGGGAVVRGKRCAISLNSSATFALVLAEVSKK